MAQQPPAAWWRHPQLGPLLYDFATRANAAALEYQRTTWPQAPVYLTSWYRDGRANAAAGGAQFSQHLVGLAGDLVAADQARLVRYLRGHGLHAIAEGDHVHVQYWPAGTLERILRGELSLAAAPRAGV